LPAPRSTSRIRATHDREILLTAHGMDWWRLTNGRTRPAIAFLVVLVAACASGGGKSPAAAPPKPPTFEQALALEGGDYDPSRGFRAVAEADWARTPPGEPALPFAGSAWRIAGDCVVRFDSQPDALAVSDASVVPTRRVTADACHGHAGFWQQSGSRVFWWLSLPGGWSAEFHGELEDDTLMSVRRYALRHEGPRAWRVDRAANYAFRATRVMETAIVGGGKRPTYDVTKALRALGEADWATRPGAGNTSAIAGTRWRDGARAGAGAACVVTFGTEVVTRASAGQRLTRMMQSTGCGGLRGSWQQSGRRLFWRVNVDSTTATESYAEVVSDTLMRTRHYQLRRPTPRQTWQATWAPAESRPFTRVRR
jgi:hypothetical protein